MKVMKKATLFQLCKTTIMRLHISEMHKQGPKWECEVKVHDT